MLSRGSAHWRRARTVSTSILLIPLFTMSALAVTLAVTHLGSFILGMLCEGMIAVYAFTRPLACMGEVQAL